MICTREFQIECETYKLGSCLNCFKKTKESLSSILLSSLSQFTIYKSITSGRITNNAKFHDINMKEPIEP